MRRHLPSIEYGVRIGRNNRAFSNSKPCFCSNPSRIQSYAADHFRAPPTLELVRSLGYICYCQRFSTSSYLHLSLCARNSQSYCFSSIIKRFSIRSSLSVHVNGPTTYRAKGLGSTFSVCSLCSSQRHAAPEAFELMLFTILLVVLCLPFPFPSWKTSLWHEVFALWCLSSVVFRLG